METGTWDFSESEYWYKQNLDALMFDAECDGERYVFAIPVSVINDHFGTDDSKDDAFDNYQNNIDDFQAMAVRFASDIESDDEIPHYFIDSKDFANYF
ncbi:hypothetical protein L3X65_22590 [Vibrio diabolicus]|uniref:hypothetical protein n=1 Tax=Vibrio harveyi group TaxID=717610 RepID=UPI00211AD28A|nr:hypothetical protein [Vibrio diabolicus]MCG9231928.1 hypothetical protein [Vibrio diabolicus]MCG9573827.1 hypothetical protein [Vibrio diabolicus]MCG9594517.1 hypothetical protein [Vibrio diabolicus]MCS0305710.1 hypothetical protein [Vibrio diabolicus]